jgi:hypothetical protein
MIHCPKRRTRGAIAVIFIAIEARYYGTQRVLAKAKP